MRRVARTPPLKAIADPDGTFDDESPAYRALVEAHRARLRPAPTTKPARARKKKPGRGRTAALPGDPSPQTPPARAGRPYPGSVPLTVGRTFRGFVAAEPAAATGEQVASYLAALLTAGRVPPEVTAEREATCAACPHARWSMKQSAPWCSICGCKVGGATKYVLKKLTEVEENLPKWGCHHPKRDKGEGWRR